MKELSLHILDIAQNSLSAGAGKVEILLCSSAAADEVEIVIKDNGSGMPEQLLRKVTDPFTTTRTTREVGMGLPLFKMAAEMTGGRFHIQSATGKGTTVTAVFVRSSVDRPPLGDMAGTLVTLIQGHPETSFFYRYRTDRGAFAFDTEEMRETLGDVSLADPEVLTWIQAYTEENQAPLDGGRQDLSLDGSVFRGK